MDYAKFCRYLCRIVILYIFTVNAYASLPTDNTRLLLLVLTTAYIVYVGRTYSKRNLYFPTMFTWSLAIMPWAFFVEMRILYGSFNIDMVKYVDKFSYSMTVYNAFRYTLTIFVLIIMLRDVYRVFKGDD